MYVDAQEVIDLINKDKAEFWQATFFYGNVNKEIDAEHVWIGVVMNHKDGPLFEEVVAYGVFGDDKLLYLCSDKNETLEVFKGLVDVQASNDEYWNFPMLYTGVTAAQAVVAAREIRQGNEKIRELTVRQIADFHSSRDPLGI